VNLVVCRALSVPAACHLPSRGRCGPAGTGGAFLFRQSSISGLWPSGSPRERSALKSVFRGKSGRRGPSAVADLAVLASAALVKKITLSVSACLARVVSRRPGRQLAWPGLAWLPACRAAWAQSTGPVNLVVCRSVKWPCRAACLGVEPRP